MRVPPAQPAASRCRRSWERHGSGSRSASDDAGDPRVEDEAVHVGELAAERAGEAQVEEAVLAHRPAHVEQQDEARAHAAALLPREPERRAAAADAAPDRAAQVEAAAMVEARLAPQLQVPQAPGEAAHQRLDARARRRPGRARGNSVDASDSSRLAPCRGATPSSPPQDPSPRLATGHVSCAVAASAGRRRCLRGRVPTFHEAPLVRRAGSTRRTARRSVATRRRDRTAAP